MLYAGPCTLQAQPAPAHRDTSRLQIAVMLPLYLDSAFDAGGTYRFGKTMPAYFMAGIEAYLGVLAAIDTLQMENARADIHVFDLRSDNTQAEKLIRSDTLGSMDLLMGHVTLNEAALLSKYAAGKKIPFFNLNLPNDAGSSNNPFHILLNPTLATHCKALYNHLQQTAALETVTYIQRNGPLEEKLNSYLAEAEKNSAGTRLKIQRITVQDSLDNEVLLGFADSLRANKIVIASFDQVFVQKILQQLGTLPKTVKWSVAGMPNWDQWDLTKPAFHGVEITYGNTLNILPENKIAQRLQQKLKSTNYIRTSESTYRSMECLYFLGHLSKNKNLPFMSAIKGSHGTLFGEWDIAPVYNKKSGAVDFYENKKISFLKKVDGQLKIVP